MPDYEDVGEMLEDAADEVARYGLVQSVLNPPGDSMDAAGRFYSPWIERGSDTVPHSVDMPTMADMRGMNAGELSGVCQRYGYVDTWDKRIGVQEGFLQRFNIGPDDPRFGKEMARLGEKQHIAMLGHTRRLAQRHETLRSIDGNLDQQLVYINESSEPCEECEPCGGMEGTYRQFAEDGMLPGDRCLGLDNCMCTTMRVG